MSSLCTLDSCPKCIEKCEKSFEKGPKLKYNAHTQKPRGFRQALKSVFPVNSKPQIGALDENCCLYAV